MESDTYLGVERCLCIKEKDLLRPESLLSKYSKKQLCSLKADFSEALSRKDGIKIMIFLKEEYCIGCFIILFVIFRITPID